MTRQQKEECARRWDIWRERNEGAQRTPDHARDPEEAAAELADSASDAWRKAKAIRDDPLGHGFHDWFYGIDGMLRDARALLNGDTVADGLPRFRLVGGYRQHVLSKLDEVIRLLDYNGKQELVDFADFERCGSVVYLRDAPKAA